MSYRRTDLTPLLVTGNAGFIALSMLTPLFLLATKNSPLSLLLGASYLSLNWAHRWVGRLIWLSATVHGFQWMVFYACTDGGSEILKGDKVLRGIATWVLLTVLAGTSIRPVRRRWYQLFWYTQ
jgi:ferric-chelate reductase